jgi:glycerol-3-phosphate dehydrogenase
MTTAYDVVIIGGGIHGVGVAQAAAAAGHRALLLEKTALASATSSRSSKLIHGGLRYLESAQFGLVRESLRERTLLLQLAPDLVRLLPFHIPIYAATTRRPWKIRAGLSLYALLGNLAPDCRFTTLPRGHWPALDGLAGDGLQAVFRYYDAQTDDAALTRAVMASAQALGAELACPARFVAAQRQAGGYAVNYTTPTADITCHAHCVVNAAGPWAAQVQRQFLPAQRVQDVHLVQGTHIQVAGRLTQGAYYLESPQDGRAVFVMPWYDRTLVGTTESVYTGDLALVQPLPGEIAYLLQTLAHYFPGHPQAVVDSFAGLRVLPGGDGAAFHRPRETRLQADDPRRPASISIYGGKLTGYRATAQRVMRLLQGALPQRQARADTAKIPL